MLPFISASTEVCNSGVSEGRCDAVCGIGALDEEEDGSCRICSVSCNSDRGCCVVRMRERRVDCRRDSIWRSRGPMTTR